MVAELIEKEFLDAFQSLKNDKSPGCDELCINVIKSVYNEIKASLMHVFGSSIDNGSFSEKMKIAKVTTIFKAGKKEIVTNYRPISALHRLSKILERIMYNRLYSHFDQNEILYGKQFGFRAHHSTGHPLVELVNSIFDSFNERKHTIGILVNLSKAFDTVDHDILIIKTSTLQGNHLN